MFISTDSSHLNQVFTRRNEPFSLESVVEILRFLMKFTVFLHITRNGEFYEKSGEFSLAAVAKILRFPVKFPVFLINDEKRRFSLTKRLIPLLK